MEFSSTELQLLNQKHATPGEMVRLSPVAELSIPCDTEGAVIRLTRKQSDGLWFAVADGEEWCIGSGYDWKLRSAPTTDEEPSTVYICAKVAGVKADKPVFITMAVKEDFNKQHPYRDYVSPSVTSLKQKEWWEDFESCYASYGLEPAIQFDADYLWLKVSSPSGAVINTPKVPVRFLRDSFATKNTKSIIFLDCSAEEVVHSEAFKKLPYWESPTKLPSEELCIMWMLEHPFINLDKVDETFPF